MKEIPEKWYVLYSSREEFDIIKKYFNKNWNYYNTINENGYCNDQNVCSNNWVDLKKGDEEDLINNNFIQISFEDFVKYIINKEPLDKTKENYNYLKPFLKKLNIK